MAKYVYMSKKTRETIANALTLKDRKERNKIINHEVYDLFLAEHRDYQINKSDVAIFQNWKKEFLAKNFGTETTEQTTAKTSREKTKSKTAKTTAKTSRDKKSKTTATTTATKTKTNTKSKSRTKSETENAPEIDTCDILAKLKADYISGKISATDFANGITAIAKLAVEY